MVQTSGWPVSTMKKPTAPSPSGRGRFEKRCPAIRWKRWYYSHWITSHAFRRKFAHGPRVSRTAQARDLDAHSPPQRENRNLLRSLQEMAAQPSFREQRGKDSRRKQRHAPTGLDRSSRKLLAWTFCGEGEMLGWRPLGREPFVPTAVGGFQQGKPRSDVWHIKYSLKS